MADLFTKKKRSEIMGRIRGTETGLEKSFRKALWAKGIRYRKNSRKHFGRPDIVISRLKTVIFLDSCFLHGCPKHFIMPKSNHTYWRKKIRRNRECDKEVGEYYRKLGWRNLRFWAHELKDEGNLRKVIKKYFK